MRREVRTKERRRCRREERIRAEQQQQAVNSSSPETSLFTAAVFGFHGVAVTLAAETLEPEGLLGNRREFVG